MKIEFINSVEKDMIYFVGRTVTASIEREALNLAISGKLGVKFYFHQNKSTIEVKVLHADYRKNEFDIEIFRFWPMEFDKD